MTESRGPVLCFGEILWDSLPRGLFPGGAPFNVAWHLRRLGERVLPVTAVGRDVLGDELLRRLRAAGIDTSLVGVVPDRPTGLVRVDLESGAPGYEILPDAAWDRIEEPPHGSAAVPGAAALVFGSLAQRSAHNRRLLADLRKRASRALQVFDVNFRPPFDDLCVVRELAAGAGVLKLNHEELARFEGRAADAGEEACADAARSLAARTGCPRICVTAGAAGAGLLSEGGWTWVAAEPVRVRDPVGAGDAFLAVLVHGLLSASWPPRELLARAHRLAGFVATRDGATPDYDVGPVDGVIAPRG